MKEKKSILIFGSITFMLSLLLLFVCSGAFGAATVYVAADGTGDYNCDGTDDHIEINQALSYIDSLGGGTVHLKSGIYTIGDTLVVYSNTILEGDSWTSVIKLKDSARWWSKSKGLIENVNRSLNIEDANIIFQNFKVDANRDKQSEPSGQDYYKIIHIGKTKNIVMANLSLNNNKDDAIAIGKHTPGTGYNILIKNVEVKYTGHAGVQAFGCQYLTVENSSFMINSNSGIRPVNCNHVIIRNNDIYGGDAGPAGSYAYGDEGIQLEQHGTNVVNDVLIENNTIRDIPRSGIVLMAGDPLPSARSNATDVIIRNNRIYYSGRRVYNYNEYGGIQLNNFDNTLIENNAIFNNKQDGIWFASYDYPSDTRYLPVSWNLNTIVKNNLIIDNTRYGLYISPEYSGKAFFSNSYNDIWGNIANNYGPGSSIGIGDLSSDPLLAYAPSIVWGSEPSKKMADLHLKSQGGRWTTTGWVIDSVTSPAIAAGDPTSDNSQSPWGGVIEMGVYGNTAEASKGGGPDTLPPTIKGTDPANQATNVSAGKTLTINLSENVQAGVNYGSITLKDENNALINTTNSLNGNILTIIPTALEHSKTYTVFIPAGAVKDLAGNELAGAYSFSFTTSAQPVLTSLTISPASVSIVKGNTQTFIGQGKDQFGNPMNVPVSWNSSDSGVGTINAEGIFTAITPGQTTISASSGEISATVTITVLAQAAGNLIGYWKFDENSGIVASDSSGNNNAGMINGATWTSGKESSCLQFNGTSSHVEVPKSASLDTISSQITVSAWIKAVVGARGTVLERWSYYPAAERAYILTVEADGTLMFMLSPNGNDRAVLQSSGKISPDLWTHIAVTSDGTIMKLYINGNPDPTSIAAPIGGIYQPGGNLNLGAWRWSDSTIDTYFNGQIDEVKLYSRALSEAEISADYAGASSDTISPAIAIVSPADGSISADNAMVVSGTASDNVSVNKVEVKVNAEGWQPAAGTNFWSKDVILAAGTNTIYAKATDTAGNSREISITVNCNSLPVEELSSQKITVYPNPYIKGKSSGEKINFSNLPQEATINIYSLSGELIQTIEHFGLSQEEWSIAGIPSGIYLYCINSSQGSRKGKLSIIK